MRVELFSHLRRAAGAGSIEIKVEGEIALKDALNLLPDGIRELVLDEYGSIRSGLLILVNGVDARTVYGYKIAVRDEDTISIVPLIHGGSSDGRRTSAKMILRRMNSR
ncbi:MAG: MoaD/ThiS family protein [Aigarchaeota archaeon]|nr:MoaD/ThiS family protein [Aigarchaeota archaeon]MCS7117956.1 MoaD/ThiS family protein [Candidatus Calditenuaceae archaeon]MDW8041846.1 MoaD/ThiS family protein [Nitrososphaerota archaeon]